MNVLDSIFLVVLIVLVIRATLRGFVEEFLSLAAVILGGMSAFLLLKPVASYVRTHWGVSYMPEVLAFLGVFVLVFILVKIFQYILSDIVERINLEPLDRFLGFFLGLVEGLLVVSLVLFLIYYQPFVDSSKLLASSVWGRFLLPLVTELHRAAGPIHP